MTTAACHCYDENEWLKGNCVEKKNRRRRRRSRCRRTGTRIDRRTSCRALILKIKIFDFSYSMLGDYDWQASVCDMRYDVKWRASPKSRRSNCSQRLVWCSPCDAAYRSIFVGQLISNFRYIAIAFENSQFVSAFGGVAIATNANTSHSMLQTCTFVRV